MDQLTDPREMRQRLRRVAYGRDRIDGRPVSMAEISPTSALVNACMRMGEREGWSGEDTMTALAYHALRRCEALQDSMLYEASIRPSPFMTPKD